MSLENPIVVAGFDFPVFSGCSANMSHENPSNHSNTIMKRMVPAGPELRATLLGIIVTNFADFQTEKNPPCGLGVARLFHQGFQMRSCVFFD